jgi:hypothetical protein
LFDEFGLEPEGAFRVVGEQIDGAFRHENEDYLLEARWRRELTEPKDLTPSSARFRANRDSREAFFSR